MRQLFHCAQAVAIAYLVVLAGNTFGGETAAPTAAQVDTDKASSSSASSAAEPAKAKATKDAITQQKAPAASAPAQPESTKAKASHQVIKHEEVSPSSAPMLPELADPKASEHSVTQAKPAPDPIPSSQPVPFTIDPNAPATADDRHFFNGLPGVQDLSALRPGNFENTKYKWYGFVRLDGIFDFNPIKSTDDFVTSSIPIPQERGQNAVLTPRYTRLGFDTSTPWESMDWTIKTRIEVDFFNGNTSGVFGSYPLRLRFAWIDFGPFLIGQAASLFMDYDVFPNVLDYEGPPGMVLMRQGIASVHCTFCEKFKVSVGIEQPYSDISWFENGQFFVNPGTGIGPPAGSVGRNIQDMPDFTGNIRYTGDYGHVQVAGILRKLTFQPAVGSDFNDLGYGINITAVWHPWAHWHHCPKGEDSEPWQRCRFLAQYAAGRGIARYIQDINGLGLDATFDPINGFRALPASGWFIAYEHWWANRLASNFTVGGESRVDLTDTLPDSTYKAATYLSANLIWLPVDRMGVGLEYLYGTRENKNGDMGTAHRLQAGIQYRF
jgi:hypothetical protein